MLSHFYLSLHCAPDFLCFDKIGIRICNQLVHDMHYASLCHYAYAIIYMQGFCRCTQLHLFTLLDGRACNHLRSSMDPDVLCHQRFKEWCRNAQIEGSLFLKAISTQVRLEDSVNISFQIPSHFHGMLPGQAVPNKLQQANSNNDSRAM